MAVLLIWRPLLPHLDAAYNLARWLAGRGCCIAGGVAVMSRLARARKRLEAELAAEKER